MVSNLMFGKSFFEIFSEGLTHNLKGVSLRPPICQLNPLTGELVLCIFWWQP